jgi:hypothetical protein
MHIDALFSQFIREKVFLSNISPRTVKAFKDCERAYKRTVGDELPTKQNLKEFVIKLQESSCLTILLIQTVVGWQETPRRRRSRMFSAIFRPMATELRS